MSESSEIAIPAEIAIRIQNAILKYSLGYGNCYIKTTEKPSVVIVHFSHNNQFKPETTVMVPDVTKKEIDGIIRAVLEKA